MKVAAVAGAVVAAVAVTGYWAAEGSSDTSERSRQASRPAARAAPADPPTVDVPAGRPAVGAAPRATGGPTVRPRQWRAALTIPAIGVRSLPVVPYRGEPDDARGTRIQNRGVAASPHGPAGGAGPGQVGNYVVTGHRLSAGGPLRRLPELRRGDVVRVTVKDAVYVYEVTRTMRVSFRSEGSKALQTTPVPGRPGREATRPMLTLSTCATPEDRAAGNLWSDRFGNPEHRIDKVAVLVDVRPR